MILNTPSFPSNPKKNIKHANIYGMAKTVKHCTILQRTATILLCSAKVTTQKQFLHRNKNKHLLNILSTTTWQSRCELGISYVPQLIFAVTPEKFSLQLYLKVLHPSKPMISQYFFFSWKFWLSSHLIPKMMKVIASLKSEIIFIQMERTVGCRVLSPKL